MPETLMRLEELHTLFMEFQKKSIRAKSQATLDMIVNELKVAMSRLPNGPQMVALIDWSAE